MPPQTWDKLYELRRSNVARGLDRLARLERLAAVETARPKVAARTATLEDRASWRVPFEAIVRPVKSNNDSIQTVPRFSRRDLAKSPGLCWAFHKQKSESLAALMLAHNLLRGRFLDASGGLGGKTTGHFL
jgi:hypothetical protein